MRAETIALLSIVAAACPALAGTRRHDVADSNYTSLAADPKYAAVGALVWDETGGTRIGSGTLLSSEWVLTAAHVVDGSDPAGGDVTNMRFFQGAAVAGTGIVADQWLSIPGWNRSSTSGLDIGLVHLSTDIFGVTPANRYIGTGEKTLTGTSVGYGLTGTGTSGIVTPSAGTKRAGNNIIDKFGGESVTLKSANHTLPGNSNLMFSDFDEPGDTTESSMGANTPLAMEYQIAGGDSGGPVFIEPAGQPLIAAVHSIIFWMDENDTPGVNNDGNSDYGDTGGSTRLNGTWQFTKIINDWISSVITVPGDADSDFDVDLSDLSVLAASYGIGAGGHWHLGDFDLDGDVDLNDLSSLAGNYGSGEAQAMADFQSLISVPEPAAIALLPAMAILLRRRGRA